MRMKNAISAAVGLSFLSVQAMAADLNTNEDKASYAIGLQTAMGLKRQGLSEDVIRLDALMAGIKDALEGNDPQISVQEMKTAVNAINQQLKAKAEKVAADNLERSKAFLAKNKEKSGVEVTDSGLQYKVLEKGSGKKPSLTDTVKVNYKGSLIDGTVFDSSYERGKPTEFQLDAGIIKGWKEALQMMPVGSKWRLFLPPQLAYGQRGQGNIIGPNLALIFDVELLDIVKK